MKKIYLVSIVLCFAFFKISAQQGPCMSLSFTQTASSAQAPNCNGYAEVFINGGQPPYKYKWNGDSTLNVSSRNNLCNGNYNVEVRDSLGCFQSVNINVGNQPCMSLNFTQTASTAQAPNCNGYAEVFINGGQPPYKFKWNGDSTINVKSRNNLCNGNYNVEVRDSLGCYQSININLGGNNNGGNNNNNQTTCPSSNNNPGFEAHAIATNANQGQCNAVIEFVTFGGKAPFTYKLDGNVVGGSIVQGKCAGGYAIEVIDSLGCRSWDSVFVHEFDNAFPCNENKFKAHGMGEPVTSANNCDGTLKGFADGGRPPYTYTWNNVQSGTFTGKMINNVCPGRFVLSITDSAGCQAISGDTINIEVRQQQGPCMSLNFTQTPSTAQAPNCNGYAEVFVSGGLPPYKYKWNGDSTINVKSRNNLCNGNYNVEVRDSLGCYQSVNINLGNQNGGGGQEDEKSTCPGKLEAHAIAPNTNPGKCDANLEFVVIGGKLPFTYKLDGRVVTKVVENICKGRYFIEVIDGEGCRSWDSAHVEELNPNNPCDNSKFKAHATERLATSGPNACDGSAEGFAIGGRPPYTYTWTSNVSSATKTGKMISNLCVGDYYLVIKDSANCTAISEDTAKVKVKEYDGNPCSSFKVATNTFSEVNDDCKGMIEVKVDFFAPPLQFVWADDANKNSANRYNLCSGTYSLTVMDAKGCDSSLVLNVDNRVEVVNSDPCKDYSIYTRSTLESAPNACDGTAEVMINGGKKPFTISWVGKAATTPFINGLCNGSQLVSVTDSLGCVLTQTAQIATFVQNDPCVNFKISMVAQNLTKYGANDGSVRVIPEGGKAPFNYKWRSSNVNADANLNVSAGWHYVRVKDAAGCILVDSAYVGVNAPPSDPCEFVKASLFTFNSATAASCDGYLEAVSRGGVEPYTITWYDAAGNIDASTTLSERLAVCPGKYGVKIVDGNNCEAFATTYVGIDPPAPTPAPSPTVQPLRLVVRAVDVTNTELCNGTANASVTGGVAPYKFKFGADSVVNSTGTYTVGSLCAGFYTMFVIDNANNAQAFQFVVGSPRTTHTPPEEEYENLEIKDTVVSPAVQSCTVDFDAIDSIKIGTINTLGTDSVVIVWNVYQPGDTTAVSQTYYIGQSQTGLFTFVLDLFCTFRASGNARGVDYIYIDTRSSTGETDGDGISSSVELTIEESGLVAIYPNPFDTDLTIVVSLPSSVEIVDLYGRTVYQGSVVGKDKINSASLSSGVYIVSITNDKGKVVKKLIKR